jgi:hypothetical protein
MHSPCASQLTHLPTKQLRQNRMRDKFKPVRVRWIVGRLLPLLATAVLILMMFPDSIQAKDEPSVGEHDNSLSDYYAHPQLTNRKAHCDCPPRANKASSSLDLISDNKYCLYKVGTQVKYSCLSGHVKLTGSEHLECIVKEDRAIWDKDPLQCESNSDILLSFPKSFVRIELK